MQEVNNWVDYYNLKATKSDDPLEVSDMHIGDSVANQLFLQSEEMRMRALLQPINEKGKSHHLLDLGCSAGTCTSLLEKYFDRVTGVDLAANTVDIAKKRLPQCNFLVDDITKLPTINSDNDFTHMVSYGVIHYLSPEGLVDFFATLGRIAQKGTRIAICRVPNKDHYEAYQEFRQQRNISRKLMVKDQLQWNWISEDFVRAQVQEKFEFISILPVMQLELPMKAFWDFVLIRK